MIDLFTHHNAYLILIYVYSYTLSLSHLDVLVRFFFVFFKGKELQSEKACMWLRNEEKM